LLEILRGCWCDFVWYLCSPVDDWSYDSVDIVCEELD